MYQRGNLVSLAAAILGKSRPEDLSALSDAERRMLSRNIKGLQITVVHRGDLGSKKRFKVLLRRFTLKSRLLGSVLIPLPQSNSRNNQKADLLKIRKRFLLSTISMTRYVNFRGI